VREEAALLEFATAGKGDDGSMGAINWQFNATIPGGPVVILNQPSIPLEAYDVASLTIPAGKGNVAVPIQPSAAAGDVVFLVISSSVYDAGVNYTVDGLTAVHALDGPHVLLGSGAVSFLNSATPPQTLTFNNTLTKDINLQVVVGRKVP
jgi:hypothetical protein